MTHVARKQRARRAGAVIAALLIVGVGAACAPAKQSTPPGCDAPSSPPAGVIADNFNAVNRDRAAAGVPTLEWNGQLSCLASDWSAHMASTGQLEHRDLRPWVESEYGSYRTLGENILRGPASISGQDMENAWMASESHRANILSANYTSIGIGVAYTSDGDQVYVTQDFGG